MGNKFVKKLLSVMKDPYEIWSYDGNNLTHKRSGISIWVGNGLFGCSVSDERGGSFPIGILGTYRIYKQAKKVIIRIGIRQLSN